MGSWVWRMMDSGSVRAFISRTVCTWSAVATLIVYSTILRRAVLCIRNACVTYGHHGDPETPGGLKGSQ
jgi:hypothetical protein